MDTETEIDIWVKDINVGRHSIQSNVHNDMNCTYINKGSHTHPDKNLFKSIKTKSPLHSIKAKQHSNKIFALKKNNPRNRTEK